MMLLRAYIRPWHETGTAMFGYGRGLSLRGLGDVLSDAASKLTAAGYTGVQCKPVVVSDPGTGATWTNNECTATNTGSVIDANLVGGMSQQGLATQLADEQTNSSDRQEALNLALLTGNVENIATAMNASPGLKVYQSYNPYGRNVNQLPSVQQAASQVSATQTIPAATQSDYTPSSSSTTLTDFNPSSLLSGNGLLYLGVGVAALVLLSGMGGRK